MFYDMLAEIKVKDALREAERNRSIGMANRSRKIHNRQSLAKLARRFGLTQTYKRMKTKMSRQQFDIKDMSFVE